MICVLPFCQADTGQFREWISWNHRLGPCRGHSALLVCDESIKFDIAWEFIVDLRLDFANVDLITNGRVVSSWPQGANSAFSAAAKHIRSLPGDSPWFWCEPDCIPLKSNWLDSLELAHAACGRKFMGALITNQHPHPELPDVHLAGCAVYPHDAIDVLGPYCNGSKAWDMAAAKVVVPLAANTNLIQNFWGQKNLPPTFVHSRGPTAPENAFTLRSLNDEAVVFHRNKDATLIRLLWRSMFGDFVGDQKPFVVVWPFHNGDAQLLFSNLRWQIRMGQERKYDAVLSAPNGTIKQFVAEGKALAERCYKSVEYYEHLPSKYNRWPQAANSAFQHTARYMQHAVARPWLWAEPDMIPLCKDWLDVLQTEYASCGKPVMGSIVPVMGHMNGTGVYPAYFPEISPRAMASVGGAFDTDMKEDIEGRVHNASHLMQHCWGILGGKVHHNSGPPPSFRTPNDIEAWVNKGAVTFHRCKDGSLIKIMEQMLIKK